MTVVQVVNATGAVTPMEISNWCYADPICTLLFTCLVIGTTIGTAKQTVNEVLMKVPSSIDARQLLESLTKAHPSITALHDLHVWKIGQGIFLTAHVEVAQENDQGEILTALHGTAGRKFGVNHATFQLEPKGKFDRSMEHLMLGSLKCGM